METNDLSSVYAEGSPTRCLLDLIADKWTAMVMGLLGKGPKRFTVLRREVGGITQKMLTQTLRRLERSGLVSRSVYAEVPPRVEYSLTPLGQTLCEPFAILRDWAESHHCEVVAAQHAYDCRNQADSNRDEEAGR